MARLIHREISESDGVSVRQATHVYDNGDVWQISHDDSGTFAFRITNGYTSRYFPSAEHVRIFGYPDDWKV